MCFLPPCCILLLQKPQLTYISHVPALYTSSKWLLAAAWKVVWKLCLHLGTLVTITSLGKVSIMRSIYIYKLPQSVNWLQFTLKHRHGATYVCGALLIMWLDHMDSGNDTSQCQKCGWSYPDYLFGTSDIWRLGSRLTKSVSGINAQIRSIVYTYQSTVSGPYVYLKICRVEFYS